MGAHLVWWMSHIRIPFVIIVMDGYLVFNMCSCALIDR